MLGFLGAVLRGVGQVIFLNNATSGLLCLIAILLNSPLHGAAALAGTVVGTVTARLLKADPAALRHGIFGFNGCLIGIAVPVFLGDRPALWPLALLAAGLSAALLALPRRAGPILPPLTAPFVLGSWALIALAQILPGGAGPVPVPLPFPVSTVAAGGLDIGLLVVGAFSSMAQVYLQSNPLSGLVIALALLVASRRVFALAGLAALASAVVALGIGADDAAIRSGLFGYNAVLAAIAIGAIFLRPGRAAFGTALGAAVAMPVIQMACASVLAQPGLATLSLPFLLTTWAVLLAARALARRPPTQPAA